MKHISTDLESKIREQIAFVSDRMKDYLDDRMQRADEDGIPPPCEANELEAAAWRRALTWVLAEGDK